MQQQYYALMKKHLVNYYYTVSQIGLIAHYISPVGRDIYFLCLSLYKDLKDEGTLTRKTKALGIILTVTQPCLK